MMQRWAAYLDEVAVAALQSHSEARQVRVEAERGRLAPRTWIEAVACTLSHTIHDFVAWRIAEQIKGPKWRVSGSGPTPACRAILEDVATDWNSNANPSSSEPRPHHSHSRSHRLDRPLPIKHLRGDQAGHVPSADLAVHSLISVG